MKRSTPNAVGCVVALVLLATTPPAAAQDVAPKSNGAQGGLGLMLSDEGEQIVVRAIRPESIAAKAKTIEVGARLTHLKIGDTKTSLDGRSSRDVRDLVRGASYDEPDVTIWFVLHNGEAESKVTLRRSNADILAARNRFEQSLFPVKIDVPTSIEQAVRDFNERAKRHPVGKSQPPISTDEVVAVIRSLHREGHPRWTDDVFRKLLDIAETKEIPAGSQLSIFLGYSGVRGFYISAWRVDLQIPTSEKSSTSFTIRERKISSRAMTSDEKARLEQMQTQLRKQHPSLFDN